jgi:hypothetical protein
VLDVDYIDGVFELVLVNLGPDIAHDVHVEFSHPLVGLGGQLDIRELNLWNRLRTLRPGKEIRVFLDSATNVFRRGKRNSFTATVTWASGATKQKAAYRHDLESYRGMPDIARRTS